MFFILSKILDFIVSPETWIIVFFIFGFVYINTYPQRSKYFFIASFTLLLLYTNKFLAYEAIRSWEEPVTVLTPADTAYDAAIVLGGGMATEDKQHKRVIYQKNVDRIMQGLQLYREGRVKKIIISGGAGSLVFPEMLEASILKKHLVILGFPAKDILVDSLSDNTFQNALYTKDIVAKNFAPNPKLILVTSAIHMKRSKGCFDKLNIKTTVYTTDKISGKRSFRPDMFIPAIEACSLWKKYIHEVIGYSIYKMMGYI